MIPPANDPAFPTARPSAAQDLVVERCLAHARRGGLQIPRLRIQWRKCGRAGDVPGGLTQLTHDADGFGVLITFNADLTPDELAAVAHHELAHAHDFSAAPELAGTIDREALEERARTYSKAATPECDWLAVRKDQLPMKRVMRDQSGRISAILDDGPQAQLRAELELEELRERQRLRSERQLAWDENARAIWRECRPQIQPGHAGRYTLYITDPGREDARVEFVTALRTLVLADRGFWAEHRRLEDVVVVFQSAPWMLARQALQPARALPASSAALPAAAGGHA